jgi:hypothetical protein
MKRKKRKKFKTQIIKANKNRSMSHSKRRITSVIETLKKRPTGKAFKMIL